MRYGAYCPGSSSDRKARLLPPSEDQLEPRPVQAVAPGDRIGPYRLGELLGEGGMGTVYRGFHELLQRPVALKRLRPDQSASYLARRRFLHEAQAAARLNHPAVVQIYDIFEHRGDDWIAMELVDGVPLSEVCRGAALPWQQVVRIGQNVAAALAAAHAVAILHRDLKTENVLQARTGEIKVLDFGLAKDLRAPDEDANLSRTRALVGTPRCLSPEQARGEPLDHRSDLFSFGVLLYELLTSKSPFLEKSLWATLSNVCTQTPTAVRDLVPSVPARLGRLVESLLDKLPEKRPADARTVGEILAAIERRGGAFSSSGIEPLPFGDTGPLPQVDFDVGATLDSSSDPYGLRLKERRQILVVSCDLEADDPEDLHEALPELERRIRSLVETRRGCFIPTPGDRLVICVGYPQAFEDDPRSAVLLAHAMMGEAAAWGPPKIRARCGVHGGIAFTSAGPAAGPPELGALLDRTLRVAARAPLGKILTDAVTFSLVAGQVAGEPVAGDEGGPYYEIHARSGAPREAEWLYESLTPAVGRDNEIRLLQDTFRSVAEGGFQAVQICGDGGIGKTKLLTGLRAGLEAESLHWITLTGSPETANSPFFPMAALLGHFFEAAADLTADEQLALLQARLEELDLDPEDGELLACLAPHFSASLDDFYSTADLPPEDRRERVMEALTSLLAAAVEDRPVVLVFEDLHWLDPSSLQWIAALIDQQPVPSLLLILTFRPHFVPPWGHRAEILQLNLNPLAREAVRSLIRNMPGGAELPEAVVDGIIAKADGVPLFLEELARTVLETGRPDPVKIPGTLRGSLTARLDRLGSAKTVAQFASVIGREFSLALLRSVSPLDDADLDVELKRLLEARVLFRRGAGRRAGFVFKHALLRDAAYDSLMRKDREEMHREIVGALESSHPRLVKRNPEILARHCTRGGLFAAALEHWRRAAAGAAARSANIEAVSHAREGLALLDRIEDPALRREAESDLHTSLVGALTAAKGFGAAGLEESFTRLEEVAQETADGARLTVALRGLFHLAHYSGKSAEMLECSRRFLEHAESSGDPLLVMEAHFQSGLTLFSMGELARARHHQEQALAIEAQLGLDGDTETGTVGRGKAVIGRSLVALNLWISGRPEQAVELIRRNLDFPPDIDPLSRALAQHNASGVYFEMGYFDEAHECSSKALALSHDNELFIEPRARTMLDLIELFGRRDPEGESEAVERLEKSIEDLRKGGATFGVAFFIFRLAEVLLARGDVARAELALGTAGELIESLDEHLWLSEIQRIRGELLGRCGAVDEAAASLEEALATARRQEAHSFELRALLGLARLPDPGVPVHDRLREVVESLADGPATRDLAAARDLLASAP